MSGAGSEGESVDDTLRDPKTMTEDFATGHAVVIGIANYRNISPLPDAVRNDARDVAAVLTSNAYCGYEPRNVHLLLDDDATLAGMRTALDSVAEASGPDDTVVVFFSGHGARLGDPADPESALLPVECDGRTPETTSLSETEFSSALRRISAQRLLVLIDACHSGGAGSFKGPGRKGFAVSRLQREVAWPSGSRHGPRSDRVLPGQRRIHRILERPQQHVHFPSPRCLAWPGTHERGRCDPGLRDFQPRRRDGQARSTGLPAPDLQGECRRGQLPRRARPGRSQVGCFGDGFWSRA